MFDTIYFEVNEGVALIRLDRPARLNAISPKMVTELEEVVREVRADRSLRALIVTGAGRAFCAGADISALDEISGPADAFRFIESIQGATNALENLPIPTIAAINGAAYGGGCEISLCCDLRIMAGEASIGVPEIKIGLLPGAGGTQRLSKLLPPAIATQMLYFGEPLSASEALGYGLVNAVVPANEVVATAQVWAKKLSELPPLALRSAKLLVRGAGLSGLASGIEAERQALGFLFSTEDSREGIRAFLEKRTPRFAGE